METLIDFDWLKQILGNPAIVAAMALLYNFAIGYKFKSTGTAIIILLGIIAHYQNFNMIGAGIVMIGLITITLLCKIADVVMGTAKAR